MNSDTTCPPLPLTGKWLFGVFPQAAPGMG
jgi:hypothetical protein